MQVHGTPDNIVAVLARIPVESLDAALPLYEALAATTDVRSFAFGNVRLAWIGPFLLLEAPGGEVPERAATVIVRDLDRVEALVRADGGAVLDGPMDGPNGRRLIARHADGNVLEYVEDTAGSARRSAASGPGVRPPARSVD